MLKKQTRPLDSLYFGVTAPVLSYDSHEERKNLTAYNIFSNLRVKESVARWVLMSEKERQEHNFLSWCFIDYWGRAQYEFVVCPWPVQDGDLVEKVGQKIDIYQMYLEPNEALLRKMVEEVSASSAKSYIKEVNKARREERRKLAELRKQQKENGRSSN